MPAIPTLVACLKHLPDIVSMAAAETLGELCLQPEVVVPALIQALKKGQPGLLRSAAFTALYKFVNAKNETAIDHLTREAQKEEPGVPVLILLAE